MKEGGPLFRDRRRPVGAQRPCSSPKSRCRSCFSSAPCCCCAALRAHERRSGFRAEGVLTFRVALPPALYREDHHRVAFFDTLIAHARGIPEVTLGRHDSGAADARRAISCASPSRAGQSRRLPMNRPPTIASSARGYFTALGIPLKQGRLFSEQRHGNVADGGGDRRGVRRTALSRMKIRSAAGSTSATAPTASTKSSASSATFTTTTSKRRRTDDVRAVPPGHLQRMWLVASTNRDPAQLTASARQTVREIDPALPGLFDEAARERDQRLGRAAALLDAAARRRSRSPPCSSRPSASTAWSAYTVSQRTQEIGVRLAIGAGRPRRARNGRGRRHEARAVGVVIGMAGALRRGAADRHHAVQRHAIRSIELRHHRRRTADDRRTRVLCAGTPGDERRSADGNPGGVRSRRLEEAGARGA